MSLLRIFSGMTLVLAHTTQADKALCDALDLLIDVPCDIPGPVILLAALTTLANFSELQRQVEIVKKYLAVRPPHHRTMQDAVGGCQEVPEPFEDVVHGAFRLVELRKSISDEEPSAKRQPFLYAVSVCQTVDLASVKLVVSDAKAANAAAKKKKKQERDEDYEPPAKKRKGAGREAAPSPRPRAKKEDDWRDRLRCFAVQCRVPLFVDCRASLLVLRGRGRQILLRGRIEAVL